LTQERYEALQITIWFNLIMGFYNIYLWNAGGNWFNILVGSLNVGVFVFMRHIALRKFKKRFNKRNKNEK